jgi:hypothetical protein
MNREDIIRMAQEAHFNSKTWIDIYKDEITAGDVKGYLEAFAALVASAERERIKQANAPEIERINAYIKELEDAVKTERDACAQIGDDHPSWSSRMYSATIRARGDNK